MSGNISLSSYFVSWLNPGYTQIFLHVMSSNYVTLSLCAHLPPDRRKRPGSSLNTWRSASWRRWVGARHWWRVRGSPGLGQWRSASDTTALFGPPTRPAGNTIATSRAALHLQTSQQVRMNFSVVINVEHEAHEIICINRLCQCTLKPRLTSCLVLFCSSCSEVSPGLLVLSRRAGFTIFLLWHWLWSSQ